MNIRPVRPGEGAALRDLRLRALREAPYAYFASAEVEERRPARYWQEWAEGRDRVTLVAEEGHEWLGLACAWHRPDRPDTVDLWWLWVAPQARSRGVATALNAARADWARRRGATRLEVAVAEDNLAVRAHYRRLGFVPTGKRRAMASDPTRAGIFLAAPLDPAEGPRSAGSTG